MSFPVLATTTSFEVAERVSQAGDKKGGYVQYEVEPGFTIRMRQNIDPAMDPKKLKRIISNRVSAHKSRLKKLQYVDALVKKSMELQKQTSELRLQVVIATEHKRNLENEQMQLKECMFARLQDYIAKDGVTKDYKAEKERLKMNIAPFYNFT